jgi:hypothetical protein
MDVGVAPKVSCTTDSRDQRRDCGRGFQEYVLYDTIYALFAHNTL